ncbi:MAG: rRNA maturation RNase YbeY [bacterium]
MILKNLQSKLKIPHRKVREWVTFLLKELAIPRSDLDITFVGDRKIRSLNRAYRGKDYATDVLSFPLWEKKRSRKDGLFLGDLVISGPTTLRQAEEDGKKSWEELRFLILHGVLHLLGYDHEKTEREARVMRKKEASLLHQFETRRLRKRS